MNRWVIACVLAAWFPAAVAAQMPDLSQMSGRPLPSGDLQPGSLTVRVIRGEMSNNVSDQPVELHGAGDVRTVKTGVDGRASFSGVPVGATVHVLTTLDGQRLESQQFVVPSQGGIRLVLVGGAPAPGGGGAAPAPGSAQPKVGTLALGGESRFVVEFGEGNIDFYGLLDVVNAGREPITPQTPLVIEAPAGAGTISVLEGSTPQATVANGRLTVKAPFAAGVTPVRFAYQVPVETGRTTIRQVLPLALQRTAVLIKKLPGMTFSSPQISQQQESVIEGQPYLIAQGPALAAASSLEIVLEGLPYHSVVPRWIALGLAAVIIGLGCWLSRGAATTQDAERRSLEGRREQLLGELVRLERQHGHQHEDRRKAAMGQLRETYARLDELHEAAASLTAAGSVAGEPPLRTHNA